MHFEKDYIYHVYNRSNQTVFPEQENYTFFLGKIEKHIMPYGDILAWCLMPNHFHFMIQVNAGGIQNINEKHRKDTQQLSKSWGIVLSSYTRAVNKRFTRRGFLWSHNTKAPEINLKGNDYGINCFKYIHQNPVNAGLVSRMEDWPYSSYVEFLNYFRGKPDQKYIANIELANEIFNLNKHNFESISKGGINEEAISQIF
ncbi:MAG: hypothetical protein R6V52_10400 [Bacteroidales bacterium]